MIVGPRRIVEVKGYEVLQSAFGLLWPTIATKVNNMGGIVTFVWSTKITSEHINVHVAETISLLGEPVRWRCMRLINTAYSLRLSASILGMPNPGTRVYHHTKTTIDSVPVNHDLL